MKKHRFLGYSCLIALFSTAVLAEFDVDQADSLDFEGFHQQKGDAVTLFKDKPTTEKMYQQPAEEVAPAPTNSPSGSGAASSEDAGKHFEIRERYTLGSSTATPYSALFVIEALHRQMAGICPQGWVKHGEWTVPVESDYYLHYEFSCTGAGPH